MYNLHKISLSNVNILISRLDRVITFLFSSFSEILRAKAKADCKTMLPNYLKKIYLHMFGIT